MMGKLISGFLAAVLLASSAGWAQGGAASAAGKPAGAASAKSGSGMPSDAEIADAKAKGMVWANKDSKVYHKGGRFYGKTKQGQFMTEADAQKAGYKEAKSSPVGQKKS